MNDDATIMFALGQVGEAMSRAFELGAYLARAMWATNMNASIALLEALDDLIEDFDLMDNPLWRAVALGLLGFFVGTLLMVLAAIITGNWGLPLILAVTVAFYAFTGLLADPDRDWSVPRIPGSQGPAGGGGIPLNF